jgi:hypothetical protein
MRLVPRRICLHAETFTLQDADVFCLVTQAVAILVVNFPYLMASGMLVSSAPVRPRVRQKIKGSHGAAIIFVPVNGFGRTAANTRKANRYHVAGKETDGGQPDVYRACAAAASKTF